MKIIQAAVTMKHPFPPFSPQGYSVFWIGNCIVHVLTHSLATQSEAEILQKHRKKVQLPPRSLTTSVGAAQPLCPRSRCIKPTVQFLPKEMLVETPVTCNRHKRGTSNLPNYNNKYQETLGES